MVHCRSHVYVAASYHHQLIIMHQGWVITFIFILFLNYYILNIGSRVPSIILKYILN